MKFQNNVWLTRVQLNILFLFVLLGVLVGGVSWNEADATHVRYPDLIVEKLTITPTTVAAGAAMKLTYNIYNRLSANATTYFDIYIYYSKNTSTTSTSGDTRLYQASAPTTLYTQRVTSLLAGRRTSMYTANVLLPANATQGTGYIKVRVDAGSRIYEYIYENNNIGRATITVTPPAPDLSVTSAVFPTEGSNVSQNGFFQGNISIRNGGRSFIKDFTIKYYYCTTSSSASCSLELGSEIVKFDFGTNATLTFKTKLLIMPSTAAVGTRYVRVLLDTSNDIAEFNENNNDRLDAVTVVTTRPELRIEQFSVSPNSVFTGVPIEITFQLANMGGVRANNFKIRFYYSTDPTITPTTDRYLSVERTLSLDRGITSSPIKVSIPTPSTLPLGSGYVGMFVDYNNTIPETNDSNNSRSTNIRVTGVVDLTSLTLKPVGSYAVAGGTGTLSYQIKNTGKAYVGTYEVGFYYSKTSTVTSSSLLLKTLTFSSLSQDFTEFGTVTIPVPSSVSSGQGYIGMIIDPSNKLKEPNRTNNASTTQILFAQDKDGDGVAWLSGCPSTITRCDCNDNDPTIYPGAPELCDGKDNDCDKKVEGALSRPCFTGKDTEGCTKQSDGSYTCKAPCKFGTQTCSSGSWSACQGELTASKEVCDKKDNNCDGTIDEGLNCTEYIPGPEPKPEYGPEPPGPEPKPESVAEPGSESTTDAGTKPEVSGDTNKPETSPENSDCYTAGCPAKQVCKNATCVSDPCDGVSCQAGEFCREGQCIVACDCKECPTGEFCVDGACQKDLCDGKQCKPDEVCNKNSGQCGADSCANINCAKGKICQSGICLDDPCNNIKCPTDMVCQSAQCVGKGCASEKVEEIPAVTDAGQADTPKTENKSEESPKDVVVANPDNTDQPTDKVGGSDNETSDSDGGGGCGCSSQPAAPFGIFLFFVVMFVITRKRQPSSPNR